MGHFLFDLEVQVPMPPLECGDMAFSRHDNSFSNFRRFPSSQILSRLSTALLATTFQSLKSRCKSLPDRLTFRDLSLRAIYRTLTAACCR
jgi:hypothetical protein